MRSINHYRKSLTFRFANGAAGADLVPSQNIACSGEILHIRQVNSSNTGARTAKITIVDRFGVTIWDGTAKAHNASYDHEFVTTRRILAGDDTVVCTLSGDPGASGAKIEVVFALYGRE